MNDIKQNKIISAGYWNLLKASKDKIDQIKKSINDKYKEDLANSNILKKIFLKFKIYKEIKKEISKIAPEDGLYIKNGKYEK